MTRCTSNPCLNVTFMIKTHMVRHNVHFYPRNRLLEAILVSICAWVDFGSHLYILRQLSYLSLLFIITALNMLMTTPTVFYFGDCCIRRLGHIPVTKLAFHLISLHVSNVAKLDWLLWLMTTSALYRAKPMKVIVTESALKNGYSTIIIADHGNAEMMINEDGTPNTAHTTNLVPCILVDKTYFNRSD